MGSTIRRTARSSDALVPALVAALALGAPGPVAAQAEEEAQEEARETEMTVELAAVDGSGIRGTAHIYRPGPKGADAGQRARAGREDADERRGQMREKREEMRERRGEMHGEMRAGTGGHRIVVRLRGLEAGSEYPVHVHRGTCAEGGPVFHSLESVTADESGSGSSTTQISAATRAEKMREMRREHGRERMQERRQERAGEDADERRGHPPVFVQAHGTDGAPVACGGVPMEEMEMEEMEKEGEEEGY